MSGLSQKKKKKVMSGRISFTLKKEKEKKLFSQVMSEGVFGLAISVTQFSVFITHNSKIVESMTKRLFGKR